jgi:hypothetical protein
MSKVRDIVAPDSGQQPCCNAMSMTATINTIAGMFLNSAFPGSIQPTTILPS